MPETCWASVRGEVARFTHLDNCCTPETSTCGQVTTDGFISVVITQEINAATAITVKNAKDQVCTYDPGCDSLLDLNVAIVLCKVDPQLVNLMTGQSMILDYAGNSIGFERSTDLDCDNRFSIEIWTDVPNTACAGTPPKKQYGYFLVPCLRSATITGAVTIDGTNAVSLELTAKTTIPSGWGTGPQTAAGEYKVVPIDAANTPGYQLTPIGPKVHDRILVTTIAPPLASCGCQPVTIVP